MLTKNIIIFAFNYPMTNDEELDYVRAVICKEAEQVLGVYAHETELSYVVPNTGGIDFKALAIILKLTEQECILHVNHKGEAHLLYAEDNYSYKEHDTEYLGHLVEITKEEAGYVDNTFDSKTGKYYTCK